MLSKSLRLYEILLSYKEEEELPKLWKGSKIKIPFFGKPN